MRRLRKSVKKKICIISFCIAVQGAMVIICRETVRHTTSRTYEMLLEEKDAVLQDAGRVAYITRQEIKAGEILTEENTEKRYLLSEQNPEALEVEAIGAVACADLPSGVILTTSLVCSQEYSPSERKCVFFDIGFSECFSAYSVVDVRIRYANGENYCVLKRKRLHKSSDFEDTCSFFLTEEEQLLMSAAMYDIRMYSGSELYLVGFGEERLQGEAISAYLPSEQVISQLREWSEEYDSGFEMWCGLRKELERRLEEHGKQYREGLR